jgi:hypothetical protein
LKTWNGFAARLHPGHMPTLLRFRQVLARRNRLLISIGETGNVAVLKKDTSDSSRREP